MAKLDGGRKADVRGVVASPSSRLAPPSLARGIALLSAALVSVALVDCKCGTEPTNRKAAAAGTPSASSAAPAPAREALFWDFAAPTEPALLSLWPADTSAPKPAMSGVRTISEQGVATIVVEGTNPHIEWAFRPPLSAALLTLEVESAKGTKIEVSWRSKDCATAVDACSAPLPLGAERQTLQVALPGGQIAALRISLPEDAGMRLLIHRMQLFATRRATGGFRSGEPNAHVLLAPQGLQIASSKADPSIVLQVAGLDTAAIAGVELDVGTGDFQPQLFWQGTSCPHFNEECSVRLASAASAGRFTAKLAGHPRWTGRVHVLRLDPSDAPGAYVIKRLGLLRAP